MSVYVSSLPTTTTTIIFPSSKSPSPPSSVVPTVIFLPPLATTEEHWDNGTLLNSSSTPESLVPVAVVPLASQPLVSPLIATYLIIVVVVSVVANTLVVVVRGCGRKRRLRSSHVCTLSLAVSDVAFSVLVHTLMILAALGVDPMLLFNTAGCNYYGFCAMFFGTFSMCIHASVSFIRYVNICHPERVEWLKLKYVYSLIGFSAAYAAIWALGPLLQWGRYETFEFGCTLAFSDPSQSSKSFVTCAFLFVLLLPLAIVIVCYALIVLQARKFKSEMNRIKETGKTCSILAAADRRESTVESLRKTQRSFRLHNKLVRISMVVAAGYVIGWLPYALVCMWAAYGDYNSIPVGSVRKWKERPRENSYLFTSRRENTSYTVESVPTPSSVLPFPDPSSESPLDLTHGRRTSTCLRLSSSSLQHQYETQKHVPLTSVFVSDNDMTVSESRALRYRSKYPCRRSVSFSSAAMTEITAGRDSITPETENKCKLARPYRSVSLNGFRDQRKVTAKHMRCSKKFYMNTRV